MADRNQPVGANLRRLFDNREAQEYGAAVGEGMPLPEATPTPGNRSMRQTLRGEVSPAPLSGRAGSRRGAVPESMGMEQDFPPPMSSRRMGDPEGSDEVAATLQNARGARSAAASRPSTRMTSRRAPVASGPSADDLNAMSLSRGVGADNAPDTAAAANIRRRLAEMGQGMKKGGPVKKMAKGGMVKAASVSRRGDGCVTKGKTKGRMV